MKKNVVNVFLGFLIIFFGCDGDKSNKESLIQDSTIVTGINTSYSYDQFKKSIIKEYVDSLNSFRPRSKLPKFLMNANLDVNSEINEWPNSNFVSLREEIFKNVDNVELLIEVIRNPFFKHQFEDIEKNRAKIPSDKTSNYVLAQERLKALSK
jgi:hypothetical protein